MSNRTVKSYFRNTKTGTKVVASTSPAKWAGDAFVAKAKKLWPAKKKKT